MLEGDLNWSPSFFLNRKKYYSYYRKETDGES